jgi:TRAP-type C4-dicarboxylate transport system permease small subunit
MNAMRQIDQGLARMESWLIVGFLWTMALLTLIQVGLRGLYTHGQFQWANELMGYLDWSEPLVRLLVLWVTFLGASLVTREGKHIKIDLVSTLLPKRWLPLRGLIISFFCVIVCAVMVKVCIGYVRLDMSFGGRMFLGIPSWVGLLILPIGFSSILFRFVLRGIEQASALLGGPNP